LSINLDKNLEILKKENSLQPAIELKDKDILDDYDFSREKYRKMVTTSEEAIESLLQLAMDSEHPRAFEVLSNMLKNTADITDKLVDLQQKMKKLNEKENNIDTPGVVNNNLFVGSTDQLQRFLKDQQNASS